MLGGGQNRAYQIEMIAYLDQNACSAIVRQPEWADLRTSLEIAAKQRILFCPMPYETVLESSPCHETTRKDIFDLFARISGGLVWKDFWQQLAESLLALVRNDMRLNPFVITGDFQVFSAISAASSAEFRDLKSARNCELKKLTPSGESQTMDHQSIIESVAAEPRGMLWRDMRRISGDQDFRHDVELECPRVTELLLELSLTPREAALLSEIVAQRGFDSIPIQFYHNRLAAAAAVAAAEDPRRGPPSFNDLVDQERLSVALCWADWAITDKAMARRVNDAGLSGFTGCATWPLCSMVQFAETVADLIHK